MNRIATLDGGSVFNDFGFSESDRMVKLAWEPQSAQHEAAIERLLMLYTQLHLSTPKGFFSGGARGLHTGRCRVDVEPAGGS